MYLNKYLYTFGLSNTHLCSFCNVEEEKINHILLFYYCTCIQDIWSQAQAYFAVCFFTVKTTDCHFWLS